MPSMLRRAEVTFASGAFTMAEGVIPLGTNEVDGFATKAPPLPPPSPLDPPPDAIIPEVIFFLPPLAAPLIKLPPIALANTGNAII